MIFIKIQIVQTKVDTAKVAKIDETLEKLDGLVDNARKLKSELLEFKRVLLTTYFCGMEIMHEEEVDRGDEYKKRYTLAILVPTGKPENKTFKVCAKVHRDMGNLDEETYHACVEEHGVNYVRPDWWWKFNMSGYEYTSQYGISSYGEAKKIARQMLADMIGKYCECEGE